MVEKLREFVLHDRVSSKARFYGLLALLILGISFAGLNGSLQNVDESIFAFTARDSLERNSWIIQIDRGERTFYKSPMVFWAAMLSFKVFGVSDFAGKLPAALANTAAAFALFFLCMQLFKSYKTGLMAVLMYLCSIQVYISSHQICTDVYYQTFLLISLLFCLKGIRQKPGWFFLAGLANALVFLSKSALGLVIPVTLFLFILFDRRWKILPHLVVLFVVSLAVSLPFFITAYVKEPDMFMTYFIERYLLNAVRGSGGMNPFGVLYGFGYFFVLLNVMMLPFTPGWVHVLFRKREPVKTGDIIWKGENKILTLFFLTSYVGFSLIPQRLPHYTLPMIPTLAVFTAVVFTRTEKPGKIYISHAALAGLALIVFSGFVVLEAARYPTWHDVAIGLIAMYALFIGMNVIMYVKRVPASTGLFSVVLLFFAAFTITVAVTVPMDFNRDFRNFAEHYRRPEPLYVIHSRNVNEGGKSNPVYWYMGVEPVEFADLETFEEAAGDITRGSYIIFNREYTEELESLLPSLELIQKGKIWNFARYE
jgi:4-amino-4-deoxy-L-arabinose transferase-like glycosyltransferase